MKTIGFITSPLNSGHAARGVGFYTKRLLAQLKDQIENHGIHLVENDYSADLIHYPFFDLFTHTLPIIKKMTVVTVHDVIPLEFPEHYPAGVRGWGNLQLQKLALRGVERVITDSYASVKSIHKYLGVPHDKIRLVYLAADPMFHPIANKASLQKIKTKYHLPDKFVLYVGDIGWNKNIPGLVEVCKNIKIPLVIVGKNAIEIDKLDLTHPELRHLQKVTWDNVQRLGFVPDEDLVQIYNLAYIYCQPSFAEGFGLPVLEALTSGTPVACSNQHSLPEIGGEAVEYFDPYDQKSMRIALQKTRVKDWKSQVQKFSWEKVAAETIMIYEEVLNKQ